MADSSEETKISMKIFVDREKKRVVFAEADYSFVDILFSFMTLPMGTIVKLLREHSDQKSEALGSLSTLVESVANLPLKCFFDKECKFTLLNPVNPSEELRKTLKLNIDDKKPTKYFRCRSGACSHMREAFVSAYKGTICCHCGTRRDAEISLDSIRSFCTSSKGSSVFVEDTITFIITDDLQVMPNIPGSTIQLLKGLGITDLNQLEERTVDLRLQETNATRNILYPYQGISDQLLTGNGTAANSKTITLKVSWQKSINKVLFVVAANDFVDMVTSFLTVPLGTVIGKLNGTTSVGNIDNLYASILNKSTVECYMKLYDSKDMLLQPCKVGYLLKDCKMLKCQDPIVQRGFVNGLGLVLVTDDLVITPLQAISVIDFLKRLNVPLSDIEEHEMMIGMNERLRILEASLKSSSVLTHALKLPLKKPKQES